MFSWLAAITLTKQGLPAYHVGDLLRLLTILEAAHPTNSPHCYFFRTLKAYSVILLPLNHVVVTERLLEVHLPESMSLGSSDSLDTSDTLLPFNE
jgi:hypothetical protein